MAIGISNPPRLIVLGHVVQTKELRARADNRLYAQEVTVEQETGARLAVRVYERRDGSTPPLPRIGEFWPVEASVEESREYGTSLQYERDATAALDAAFPASAGAAA